MPKVRTFTENCAGNISFSRVVAPNHETVPESQMSRSYFGFDCQFTRNVRVSSTALLALFLTVTVKVAW